MNEETLLAKIRRIIQDRKFDVENLEKYKDNDSIGAYEYHGQRGIDRQRNYWIGSANILIPKNLFLNSQIKLLRKKWNEEDKKYVELIGCAVEDDILAVEPEYEKAGYDEDDENMIFKVDFSGEYQN